MNAKKNGGTHVDTGKILMGTAMLLLMIGLLVHPVGAVKSGDNFLTGQSDYIGGSGQATDCSSVPSPNGSEIIGSDTHQYERLNILFALGTSNWKGN
ncbi:MAG: hypothetical protein WCE65_07290 [Methanoregula sp.]